MNYVTANILEDLEKNNGRLTIDGGNYFALARENMYYIDFENEDDMKFYKNAKTWDARVSRLMRTGQ